MEQSAKIKVKSNGRGFCKVISDNGISLTLQLSDKVKRFYQNGLEENKDYYIKYDDESHILLYAIEDNKKSIEKDYNNQDMILKQVALKCASYGETDLTNIKEKAKAMFKFLKEDW